MPVLQRLAVIPFENLSSDLDLDWAGRAIAAGVVYDLAGTQNLLAQRADSIQSAHDSGASQILEGYFFEQNGRLEVRVAVEDGSRPKTAGSFGVSGPLSDGVIPLVNQLAKQLNSGARILGTSNQAAFRAYGQALISADKPAVVRNFESATAADPNFAPAYLDWARFLFATGDRDQGMKVLASAKSSHLDPIDAAEIDYFVASARGEPESRAKALEALTQRMPADWTKFKELAELQLTQRKFQDAVRTYQAVTRLAPSEPANWNELGYAYASAQDLAGARRALEEYHRLMAPEELNALDSLGEVSFYLGDFESAASYFSEADRKNPGALAGAELLKTAEARLMLGDLAGADSFAQKSQKYVPLPAYQQAQWEFLTGRRKAGMARLEKLIPVLEGDLRAVGLCQLSVWKLATGNSKSAADLADQAVARAAGPQARDASAAVRVIATGSGTNAYALLFARKFAEAAPLLEAVYRGTNPSFDGQVRTLLAWAYVETGRLQDARKLLDLYPIPFSAGEPLFASLIFPRFLYLRAAVLQDAGKRADAKHNYELYLKYAGDVPEIFGDEEKARKLAASL